MKENRLFFYVLFLSCPLLFSDIVLYLCCLSMFILFLFVSNIFPSCLVFGMYLIVFVFCFFWLAIVRCLCHTCAIPSPARPWIITRWETSWKRHRSALLHRQNCFGAIYNVYIHNIYQYITIYSIIMYYMIHMLIHLSKWFNNMYCMSTPIQHTIHVHTCMWMHMYYIILYLYMYNYVYIHICICCTRNSDLAIGLFYYLDLLVFRFCRLPCRVLGGWVVGGTLPCTQPGTNWVITLFIHVRNWRPLCCIMRLQRHPRHHYQRL